MNMQPGEIKSSFYALSKQSFELKNKLKFSLGGLVIGLGLVLFAPDATWFGFLLLILAVAWLLYSSVYLSKIQRDMDRLENAANTQQVELHRFDPVFAKASALRAAPKAAKKHNGNLLAGLGAIFLLLGAILPWRAITTIFGSVTRSGMDGDGIYFFAAGIIVGLVALLHLGHQSRLYSWPLALFGLGLFVLALMVFAQLFLATQEMEYTVASIGSGPYVIFLGAILVIVSGFIKVPINEH